MDSEILFQSLTFCPVCASVLANHDHYEDVKECLAGHGYLYMWLDEDGELIVRFEPTERM